MKTANYTLKEIKPNIFHLTFQDRYDLCMYFLRYQEFYESSSPKFRNKSFTILSFMRWYSKKYGNGSFTYPSDWNGFNIPGDIIPKVHNLMIPDRNIYDYELLNIYKHCKKSSQDFYLIGSIKKDNITINHELAHGFFYTNKIYKSAMISLVKSIPKDIKLSITHWLKTKGYTPKVYTDEIQAYLATGMPFLQDNNFKLSKSNKKKLLTISLAFIKVFNQYNNENLQGLQSV
jgi:hypothetical protein